MGFVTNTFNPIDKGGYNANNLYYSFGSARIADGLVSENVYLLYNAVNIGAYLSKIDSPTVHVSFDLSTGGVVPIDFSYLDFGDNTDLQSIVVSHKYIANVDRNQYTLLGYVAGGSVKDLNGSSEEGDITLTNSQHFDIDIDASFFARSGPDHSYYRGFLFEQGLQGQQNLTQVSNFTLTVSGQQRVNIAGLFPDASIYDNTTLAAFAEVTLTNNANPSGQGDKIFITIEDTAGDATGNRGTLSLPAGGVSAFLVPDNSVPGRYELLAGGLGDLQAALRSLVYTPPNVSGSALRVNFQLDYLTQGGTGGTTTNLESILVYDDLGLNARTTTATVTDQAPFAPFAGIPAELPADDKLVYATITVGDPELGTFSGAGISALGNGVYQLDRSGPVVFSTLAAQLRALTFSPVAGRIPDDFSSQFDIQVSVTDEDGKTTKFADTLVTIIGTQPVTAALAFDTGASASDGITSVNLLRGTGEPNAVVTFLNGSTVLGTTTVQPDGTWTYGPPVQDGSYTLTVSQALPDGPGGSPIPAGSTPVSFVLDTTRPVVMTMLANDTGTPSDAITSNATLTGTGDANALVTIRENGMDIGTTMAGSNGTWTYTPTLEDGYHFLSASETDAAGNVSADAQISFLLDTAPPTLTAALANDTGISSTDGITNDATLTGMTDPNATVTIRFGSFVIDRVVAGPDGVWSYTPPFSAGSQTLTASVTDAAGNVTSVPVSFTLDKTLPAVTAALASDTGISAFDGITSNAALTGTGDANALVTIMDGANVLGTTTAESDGTWSYTPTLTDGTHVLTASETDVAGNTGVAPVFVVLDTAAPPITAKLAYDTGVSATDRLTRNGTLRGTSEANARVTIREGSAVLGTTTAGSDGAWSYTPTLTDGSHTLTASASDAAGNTSTAPSVTFTLDTARPVVTAGLAVDSGRGDTDRITKTAALKGTGEANALVTIRSGSTIIGTTTARSNGDWNFKPTLADGTYTLTASETDAAGNVGSASVRFTLDTARPVVTAKLANNTGFSATDRVTSSATLTGTGEASALVTISDGATVLGTTRAGSEGTWTYKPTLADGNYVLTASQTDAAGNTGSGLVRFTLDTTRPVVTAKLANDTGRSAADRITSDATLTGTGEANALVTVRNGETVLGTTRAGSDGAWTYAPRLADGTYTLTASEVDAAGNTGSTSIRFTLDTRSPAVAVRLASDTGPSATDGITNNATLTGTGDANAVVTIRNDSTTLGVTRAGTDGAWTYTPRLADGTYTLTASETDAAGNTGSSSVHFTLDTVPTTTFSGFLAMLYDAGGTNGGAMSGDPKTGDAIAGIAAAGLTMHAQDSLLHA